MTTKIIATVCVAGLVFLFGRWGAEALTSRGVPDQHHGEGEHEVVQAYTIDTGASGGEEGGDSGPDLATLMNGADPAKGEKVFGKCKACHAMEPGKNGTGPSLAGVYERQAGTEAGFAFSDAMVAYGQEHVWNVENLFTFLGDVAGTVPGTKMTFAGIKKEDQRADLVAYLMGDAFNADDFVPGADEEAASEDGEAAPAEGEAPEVADESPVVEGEGDIEIDGSQEAAEEAADIAAEDSAVAEEASEEEAEAEQ